MKASLGRFGALGAALTLAACAASPSFAAPAAVSWSDLPGWDREDHLAALAAVTAACLVRASPVAPVCADLSAAPPADDVSAKSFLEQRFRVVRVPGDGLLTGYFTPSYEARHEPEPPFTAPVRPRPASAGATGPDREAIEASPAPDALAWMRPEDLFFLQVQGSGVLQFPDGRRWKAVYAGSNGRPYLAIGKVLRQEGRLGDADSSADAVHGWLAAHRGAEADAVMRQNPRYIYFALRPDDGAGPKGTAGAPLPPGRALAVDPSQHALGELYWIDADSPALAGAPQAYRRLAAALDTGAAVRGAVRADLYLGAGEGAGREAGLVRHRLTLYRLEPR